MKQVLDFFKKLFDYSDWPPRWHCGEWTEFHGWLYIISDLLIWSAYFALPVFIVRYVSRKKNILFTRLYFLFAAFILACGATHFLDAVAFWIPAYRLSALVRFITGVISWVTVFYVIKHLPVIFSLRSQAALEAEIAERKKTEEELKKSRKDYELLIGGVKDYAIFMIDTEGKVASWNSGAANIMGYKAAEIIGQPLALFYTGESLEQNESGKNLEHALLNGKFETEGWRVRKNGTLFWADVVYTSLYDEEQQLYGYAKVTRDITEKKRAEDALNKLNEELEQRVKERTEEIVKKENRFRALIENNHDIISLLDSEFRVFYRSPSAVRITGWTDEDILNMNSLTNIHIDDREKTSRLIKELIAKPGIPFNTLFRSLHKKGHYIWLEGTVINLLQDENVKAIVFNFRDVTVRIEAEEKLATSELQFRSLIENSSEGIILSDEFFNIHYRSPSSVKIEGGLGQNNLLSCIHPDDSVNIKNKIEEVITKPGKPVAFEGRFLHSAGHYYWLEGTLTNMLHLQAVNSVVLNYHDITERKKLEVLLHRANSLARIGGWEVDLLRGTVFWSDITREIHETEYDYVPNLNNGINFYKEGPGRNLIAQKVKEAIELGTPWDVELQIITAKNNERWIRSIGETEFADGKCIRLYGSFQDIDERKKAEIERERLNERLQLATQSARLGLWDWDIKNDKLIWDEEMYRLYNLSENEFTSVYEGWTSRLHEEDRQQVENDIQLALAGKKEYKPEFRIVWHDSSVHYISASGIIERDNDGNAIRMTGFNWDITERKRIENEIKKLNDELEIRVKERTEEMESFSYSVSHDLRAPLRAINGYARILEEDYKDVLDTEGKRLLTEVQQNAKRMGTLIDDLLAFSRLGRKEVEKSLIDMNKLADSVVREVNQTINHTASIVYENLLPVMADYSLMQHVMINLISNAVKYSSTVQIPVIEIRSFNNGEEITYSIKDNGVGFNMEYVHKLFGVFQRLHSQDEFPGTGVGLAIVQRIIHKHHGRLWAEGKEGEGATFYFALPLNEN